MNSYIGNFSSSSYIILWLVTLAITEAAAIVILLASPFIIEDNTIKYIDYDLDLRVFPNGSFKVLDRGEYNYHKKLMNYSKELDKILKFELSNLIDFAKSKKGPFDKEEINNYCNDYKNSKK